MPVAGPARKTVTVMFADLAGSTSFEERVDAETAREVIGGYHDLLRVVARHHRAGVTKYIGDGFMAVWGVPEIGPEDAVHAVNSAVELQERFVDLATQVAETHGVELALRVAVNTGEVVVGAGDADLVGDALNVCARLESECPKGHVVVGEETWRATRGRYGYESLGEVQVKGRSAPVAVYQWVARQSEAVDAAPFVGRGNEVRRLQVAMDDAMSARTARLVTVIGDPGVGKSRLAAEFTKSQVGARVVEARCVLEGTVALGPLVEVLRALDLEESIPASTPERDRLLRDLHGLADGVPGSVEENFWALRRLVEVLAMTTPVVLVLDDIQWADMLLLDFIEHLLEWVKDVPVLVLALARPELRDIRPELVTVSRWGSEAVHLGGLDAGATAELAAKVLGAARLPDELLTRLPSSTGGNPLFVRELVGMLAHDGVLVEESHGWRLSIDADAITIPPTIHALLASRLERLDANDRRVLEIASVVGSDFSPDLVRALADGGAEGIALSLKRLRRLELAQPSGSYVGDEPVWRFHHVLIRDVAYRRLLKSDRANLHERLADWVAAGGQGVAFDADEMIARHLEAAYNYRVELGTVDERTGELALRSARHYATSARRALDRDELVSAGMQAARGAAVAATDGALHAELLLIGCEAYLSAGDVAAGAPLVDDLDRIADESLAPWATCYRCQFVIYTEPERLPEVDARLQGAIDEFSRRKDSAGLAKAHRVRASARSRLGRIGDCESDLFEALIAARQSGDHRQITAALGAAPGAALWGPSPVPKAGGRCLDVVRMQRMTTAAPSLEATSLRHLAVLELLRGRPDKARKMLADARQVVADLGLRHGLMETELFAGIIESMEGDAVAAEPHFRTALNGFKALGVGADAGQAAALLARMVLAQGRVDEADGHATESERLAGRNLKTAIAWRAVRAEIHAAQQRFDEAVALAREAVAVAAGTDLVLDHADACLALRRVLEAAGDTRGANAARANAEALYIAKDVTARIGRVPAPAAPATSSSSPVARTTVSSRMTITNRAAEVGLRIMNALRARDAGAASAAYAQRFAYDDRRRISGDPIDDVAGARAAIERILQQYNHFDSQILAVRGERLALASTRQADDSGNEASDLVLIEIDEDGHITYEGRFEDDFEPAYRELERRYYAGEGAAFAQVGTATTEAPLLLNRNEFDRFVGELCTPDLHVENRTRSAIPDRSASALLASFSDLGMLVASARTWVAVLRWVSLDVGLVRLERKAVGRNGEEYAWTRILVSEFRDGLFASMCEFEPDDEDAAFEYAEEKSRKVAGRLAVANKATAAADTVFGALRARDVDSVMAAFSDRLEYDDRRHLSGNLVADLAEYRAAVAQLLTQYDRFELRNLAVRGERLSLAATRVTNDAGFEAAYLHLYEVNEDGLIVQETRFDEDDFETACRELDRRYFGGEGAAFAENGIPSSEAPRAMDRDDFDLLFGELCSPDLTIESRSSRAFPDRSADDLRRGFQELSAMVRSKRTWNSSVAWLSPTVSVIRLEREAIGHDGERYEWAMLLAGEHAHGRLITLCEFDPDDEVAAFAYAEGLVRKATSRLAVFNKASAVVELFFAVLRSPDADVAADYYIDRFEYDDHRRFGGDPVEGRDSMRDGIARMLAQYSRYDLRVMAVRGQHLTLISSTTSDDNGNCSTNFQLFEIDDDERFIYQGRFDEDDFDNAYRELEQRYYADEGAEFAESGGLATEWVSAVNRGDLKKAFGELTAPGAPMENRSRSLFPDPVISDFGSSYDGLNAMVASTRTWISVALPLTPHHAIMRYEREAVGHDGEKYSWTWIVAGEARNGQFVSSCMFDLEDEEAAFAYAQQRMIGSPGRLAVRNRSLDAVHAVVEAAYEHNVDATVAHYSEKFEYGDHRRLTGYPVHGKSQLRAAFARIFEQYTHSEWRPLAVRGNNLSLLWSKWWDDSGNETSYLHVFEIGDDGLIVYEGRFDEVDFEGACRELERRYYAGEAAAYAVPGVTATEFEIALNNRDYDRMFGELAAPDMRLVNRSRSVFPDRSVAEFRASIDRLDSMVASARTWNSCAHWVSPNWSVARQEREAVGLDGERYEWTRIYVAEIRDGRLASLVQFEPSDEDAAFAYAEERAQKTVGRFAVSNRASERFVVARAAAQALDADAMVDCYSGAFVYDDRRRLAGHPIVDLRSAVEGILAQYNRFDGRTLAVRGERLSLSWSRWRNDEGFETSHLIVHEVDDSGRFTYEGRFDEDDFNVAYREFERRYSAGEGAAFAEITTLGAEYLIGINENRLDKVFIELSDPDMRIENRTRTGFPDRSVGEFRASYEQLHSMIGPSRSWNSVERWLSPTCGVLRHEREATGRDGEHFAWSFLVVFEMVGGLATHLCQFELEDEAAAFAYAEERVREEQAR